MAATSLRGLREAEATPLRKYLQPPSRPSSQKYCSPPGGYGCNHNRQEQRYI